MTTKERFVEQVLKRAAESWPEEGSLEEKWTAVRSALTETADQQLGRVSGNNPDWFGEAMGHLTPLLQERNAAYLRYLRSQRPEDHRKFKEARGRAKREVRRAKNRWFENKAQEVEKGRFGGKTVWKCISKEEEKGYSHQELSPLMMKMEYHVPVLVNNISVGEDTLTMCSMLEISLTLQS